MNTWHDGSPVPPDYVTTSFRRLVATLEVPRLPQLRHTHATLLLAWRRPGARPGQAAGPQGPSVTLNVYAGAIPDDGGLVDTLLRHVPRPRRTRVGMSAHAAAAQPSTVPVHSSTTAGVRQCR